MRGPQEAAAAADAPRPRHSEATMTSRRPKPPKPGRRTAEIYGHIDIVEPSGKSNGCWKCRKCGEEKAWSSPGRVQKHLSKCSECSAETRALFAAKIAAAAALKEQKKSKMIRKATAKTVSLSPAWSTPACDRLLLKVTFTFLIVRLPGCGGGTHKTLTRRSARKSPDCGSCGILPHQPEM